MKKKPKRIRPVAGRAINNRQAIQDVKAFAGELAVQMHQVWQAMTMALREVREKQETIETVLAIVAKGAATKEEEAAVNEFITQGTEATEVRTGKPALSDTAATAEENSE